MDCFYVDKNRFANMNEKLKSTNEILSNAYYSGKKLMNRIDTEGLWSGESKNAFMAYMDLLSQYQYQFSQDNENNPIDLAIDTNNSFIKDLDEFYEKGYYCALENL